jgi:hypothetical protein
LLDTIYQQPACYKAYDKEDGGYPIYYIGKVEDTIAIGRHYSLNRTNKPNIPPDCCIRFISSEKMTMIVDTTVKTSIEMQYDDQENKIVNYQAYLLYIRNISDTAIWLGSTFFLPYLYQEVQNKRGEWVKINKMVSEMDYCGTGQPHIVLKPQQIILAKVARYYGDTLAKCRLAMHYNRQTVYSNIFIDRIEKHLLD